MRPEDLIRVTQSRSLSRGFIGSVVTQWLDDGRYMVMCFDFGYVDKRGYIWWACRGDVIDGASIPRAMWLTVGSPYTGKYRKAAVLHDAGYLHHWRPRKDVDRMFLEVMEYEGVPYTKRIRMYAGVRIGGHFCWNNKTPADQNYKELSPEVRMTSSTLLVPMEAKTLPKSAMMR